MTAMLASVRDLAEAKLALACGADWIDIKDPEQGALGAASAATVSAIVAWVDGRRPVSATIGDCWDEPQVIPARARLMCEAGVDYVKAGLNAARVEAATVAHLTAAVETGARVIVVCMAESPPGANELEALAATGISGVMLDTANKAGPGLTALLSPTVLAGFVAQARACGVLSGLAGRLSSDDIEPLAALGADYLGFRIAVCDGAVRQGGLSTVRLKAVRAALRRALEQQATRSSEVA